MKKIAALALVCGFALPGCDVQKALTQKHFKALEKGVMRAVYLKGMKPDKLTLAERMAFYKVPGVSVALFDKNRIEGIRAYGAKDALTHSAVDAETLFQSGAFSQMMTAGAVLRLVEQGKLDSDADIETYLKSWKLPPPADPKSKTKITLRALLTHSAGLSDQVFPGYAQDEPLPPFSKVLEGDKPANNGPVWAPGRKSSALRARFSESGFVLVQQILEDLARKPFPDFMKETILDPLGLADSTFALPFPAEFRPRAAAGHLREGQQVKGQWNNYPEAAAKGLWTTPAEFASFLTDLLQSASGTQGKLLSPGMARAMLSAQVENFGFGFLVEGKGDDIVFNLRGKTRGYSCQLVIYPAKGQGAVIMTNSDNGLVLIPEILAALSDAYGWPHYKPEEKTVLRLEPETYRQYIGRYEINPAYALDVSVEDYYLVIRPTGQAATKFYAEGPTLFYSTDPYVRIQFIRNKLGAFESLVLWQQDFELEARRIL